MDSSSYLQYPIIDPFNSEGFEFSLLEKDGIIVDITPRVGFVNQHKLIDPNYHTYIQTFNRKDRITTPLRKRNNRWEEITMQEAITELEQQISKHSAEENAIFASPENTNEELYLTQKWARAGIGSNAIHSFHYCESEETFNLNKNDILPIHEMMESKRIVIVGSDLKREHSHIHQLIQKCREEVHTPTTFLTENPLSPYQSDCDETLYVKDLFAFFYCVNLYIVQNNLQFGIFTQGLSQGYTEYLQQMQNEDIEIWLLRAKTSLKDIQNFVNQIISTPQTAFILSEKKITKELFLEVKNLMLLTEKQAKRSAGIMLLKRCCNSQGLFDMGITPYRGAGNREINDEYTKLLQETWGRSISNLQGFSIVDKLSAGKFHNLFIFGENPAQTHPQIWQKALQNTPFICVQTLFLNETCNDANLIIPTNFAFEIGGSYSNTFKVAVNFEAVKPSPIAWNNYHFWSIMHKRWGLSPLATPQEVFLETISLFAASCCSGIRHQFSLNKL